MGQGFQVSVRIKGEVGHSGAAQPSTQDQGRQRSQAAHQQQNHKGSQQNDCGAGVRPHHVHGHQGQVCRWEQLACKPPVVGGAPQQANGQ
ncbi:MAG: hypothetical protein ACKO1T_09660 [Sediminibacterium sp.]